jgi:hypothetical protein
MWPSTATGEVGVPVANERCVSTSYDEAAVSRGIVASSERGLKSSQERSSLQDASLKSKHMSRLQLKVKSTCWGAQKPEKPAGE